jgi:hypothetical protein
MDDAANDSGEGGYGLDENSTALRVEKTEL